MGMPNEERERLTLVFYSQLGQYVPSRRSNKKRPTGDALATLNLQHDTRLKSNPWFRLVVEHSQS